MSGFGGSGPGPGPGPMLAYFKSLFQGTETRAARPPAPRIQWDPSLKQNVLVCCDGGDRKTDRDCICTIM
jgi:hypothetical protein